MNKAIEQNRGREAIADLKLVVPTLAHSLEQSPFDYLEKYVP
jgi:hypothetical protein